MAYELLIEPMPAVDTLVETEPNDSPLTAAPLPLTRAVMGYAGVRLDDADKLIGLRPDGPFSTVDTFRVDEVPAGEQVVVAVVPPERGALQVIDEADLEAWRQRVAQSSPSRPAPPRPTARVVKGGPEVLVLDGGHDGVRRVRILPAEDMLPGATYFVAAATSGPNGVAALVDLLRVLETRPEAQRRLVERVGEVLKNSPELARLQDGTR
ncbi:MAG: hypothetical protein ABTQ32_29995 [Myxococcaceae bacterium]